MLNKIIESCKYVADNSINVKINKEKIIKFIESEDEIKATHWLKNSPFGLLDLPVEMIINFLLVYTSINFSFWGNPKWTINVDKEEYDGSSALLYVLLKYVKEKNTTDFSNITKEEFKEILKGNVEIPLFEERYEIITSVSKTVNKKMNENFFNYIKDIRKDEELFNVIIEHFQSFKDEREYKEKTIYFYKLAQLLTSDILHIRELKENIKVDYSNLLGCSDYKIPQVMRSLGILDYSEELSNIIDSRQEIEKGSKYEVEIRANMIVAINLIKEMLNNSICAMDINDYIYCMSKNKNINFKPYHLTRCTNY